MLSALTHNPLGILIFGGLAVFIVVVAAREFWRYRGDRSWPCVEGKVSSGRAKLDYVGRGGGNWSAELTYMFTTVEGDRYAGFYVRASDGPKDAEAWARQMIGAKVSVRYKPGDPDTSEATLSEAPLNPPALEQ